MKKIQKMAITTGRELLKAERERLVEANCNICGRIPDVDEKMIVMSFSFCFEYDCNMNICKKCVERMKGELEVRNEVKV